MRRFLVRSLTRLFPVQPREWPKALLLLSVAIIWGISGSVSRASAEGLFLSTLGVAYLPTLLLATPLLLLLLSTLYSTYTERLSNDRTLLATAVCPIPLIILLRLLTLLDMTWVYFGLYAFVLAYPAILLTSWSLYLSAHYDLQEAKRLLPLIASGLLLGGILGGLAVVGTVPLVGPANLLFLWGLTLGGGALLVRAIARRYPLHEAPRARRGGSQSQLLRTITEGFHAVRVSALFTAMAVTTVATMMALQLLDLQYSTIFRTAFPDGVALTAFLGMVDGLTTGLALLLQLFVVPWSLRRFGVQGTNLLYPFVLLVAFAGLACTPLSPALLIPAATFARFTRSSLLPTLRGTPFTLMLNAAPRKTIGLVRNFQTAMVLPLGQSAGALVLMLLKSLGIPWLWPGLGLGLAGLYLIYALKQNTAYSTALLDMLRADRVHLLDLEDDNLRHLDAEAIATISARLGSDDEEARLAAIALLRSIGSPPAYAALRAHLPSTSPDSTAAVLTALADSDDQAVIELLRPYLEAPQAEVRLAALAGLRRLGDTALPQQVLAWLDDADVQVQAAAIALALTLPDGAGPAQARRRWEAMLRATDASTQRAALSVFPSVPESSLQVHLFTALDHPELSVRCAALQVLLELAETRRVTTLEAALLRALDAEEVEVRHLALQVLTALGTDEALTYMLALLDDDQPQIRDTLTRTLHVFGERAIAPLAACLRAPQVSLLAKTSALIALARLHGTDAEQLLPFWEAELREVYQCKLMLTCLEATPPHAADAFLQAALRNAHDQIVSLLVQVLAVWTSPEVVRLVESGLHDPDRNQRASALEALESLGQRRFTRFLLPILLADDGGQETWRTVAQRQWHLAYPDMRILLEACLQSPNKWIVIGALLAGQARAAEMGPLWPETLARYAMAPGDDDVRVIAQSIRQDNAALARQSLSLPDLLLFLKRIPLYGSMSLEQLRTVALHLTARSVGTDDVIFREGDQSYDLSMIVSGQVEIRQQRGARPLTLVTLSSGDFFGDMALFGGQPRSASAVAVMPTVLYTLSPAHFRQMIVEDPAMSFEIFRALSARIRRFDEAMQAGGG